MDTAPRAHLPKVQRDTPRALRVKRGEGAHAGLKEQAHANELVQRHLVVVVGVVAVHHGLHHRGIQVEPSVAQRLSHLVGLKRAAAVLVKVRERVLRGERKRWV